MSLCRYKNILGEPNKGLHSFRLFNIAIVDLLLTIALAYLFTKIVDIPFWFSFIFWVVLAIFLHKIFCVNTTINKLLFG